MADRERFMDLYRHIQLSPAIRVVPASRALLEEAINLYASRLDKDWPLTDCISFVVMGDEGITQALTGDHHFEQAGFAALLK
jgi:predicted nucleic acid-binding protein